MAAYRLSVFKSLLQPRVSVALQSRNCSSNDLVVTEKRGDVFLIRINRPERRNAVSLETGRVLKAAIEKFQDDTESKVAVLYGKDGVFCAGYDLKELASFSGEPNPQNDGLSESLPLGPMGPTKMFFTKPVIAAVNGYAVAGGLELAMMCDLRVAEKSAIFGVFCRRFGVPLLDGGSVRLPSLIGLSRALDLILTGRPVTAEEALQFGLVNRVVDDGTVLEEAVKLANEIAAFPQQCMLADRRSAFHTQYDSPSMEEALQYEHDNGLPIIFKESVKGAKRFSQDKVGRSGSFEEFKS